MQKASPKSSISSKDIHVTPSGIKIQVDRSIGRLTSNTTNFVGSKKKNKRKTLAQSTSELKY